MPMSTALSQTQRMTSSIALMHHLQRCHHRLRCMSLLLLVQAHPQVHLCRWAVGNFSLVRETGNTAVGGLLS